MPIISENPKELYEGLYNELKNEYGPVSVYLRDKDMLDQKEKAVGKAIEDFIKLYEMTKESFSVKKDMKKPKFGVVYSDADYSTVIQNMKNNIVSKIKKISPNVEICNISLCVNTKDSHQEVDLQNLSKNNPPRLYGSSMLVINYPWKLPESSQIAMEKVAQILGQNGNGSVEVEIM